MGLPIPGATNLEPAHAPPPWGSPTGSSWQWSVRLTSVSTAADSSAMRALMAANSWLQMGDAASKGTAGVRSASCACKSNSAALVPARRGGE